MYRQPRSRAAKLGSKDKTCWLCSGFSLCWRGKVGVQGALFTVGHEYPHAPDARADAQPGVDIERQGAARQRRGCPPCHASGTPPTAPLAAPPTAPPTAPSAAAHNSRRVCYRRMSHAIPRPCVAPRIRIVGIATFVDTVEHSPNRIACETAPSEHQQRARGPDASHVGPLIRA